MGRLPLHNDDLDYETNCFVCERHNDRELQIAFFHDTERDVVRARPAGASNAAGQPR